LSKTDVVIDFTAPSCVVAHIEACVKAAKNMVVGTTGWHGDLDRIRQVVESQGTGLVYAANFSIGVNLFLEVARAAAAALQHNYSGQIFERHHADKKDAPSGTAIALQRVIRDASGGASQEGPEIISFREGNVVGMHEVVLESAADRIYLCHDAKSRHGFAEGAIRAAEWIQGKKGFYDFKDVWRQL
jgi:4-hydroxy-tetrahydrodipicolinate reductase